MPERHFKRDHLGTFGFKCFCSRHKFGEFTSIAWNTIIRLFWKLKIVKHTNHQNTPTLKPLGSPHVSWNIPWDSAETYTKLRRGNMNPLVFPGWIYINQANCWAALQIVASKLGFHSESWEQSIAEGASTASCNGNVFRRHSVRLPNETISNRRIGEIVTRGMPLFGNASLARQEMKSDIYVHPCRAIRYETMRYFTIRYDTIRYDTIRYDTARFTIRYDTIRTIYDTTQCHDIQWNSASPSR